MWDGGLPENPDQFSEAEYFPSMHVPRVCSTIGAGDAMHAGFLKEWVNSECLHRAIVYSQVVAAVSVGSEKATHGVDADTVDSKFSQVWPKSRGM